MRICNRGAQMLVTTAGAFAAFSLMTIAVGTDYWLYSPGVCRTKGASDNDTSRKNEEVLTHSGLWRQCCMEGMFTGVCKNIDHFPEDADYEQDAAEYLLRAVRASSLFPIMSVGLLFIGGVCVAASEFYKSRHNVILSAGIFFVSAGLSNIIGIIVYISSNAGDPNQSESKRSHWYGWSFYCGALSFIIAETVGVLTVHLFIDTHRAVRASLHPSLRPGSCHSLQPRRSSSYRSHCRGRLSQSRSSDSRTQEPSPAHLAGDLLLYPMSRGYLPATSPTLVHGHSFAHFHNSVVASNSLACARAQLLHGSIKSDNGMHPVLNSACSEKGLGFTSAVVKVENGPVPGEDDKQSFSQAEQNSGGDTIVVLDSGKEEGFSTLSSTATRKTTPV